MATCSSILAWEIPLTEEPGGLQPMGSQKVGHSTKASYKLFSALWANLSPKYVTLPCGTKAEGCDPLISDLFIDLKNVCVV